MPLQATSGAASYDAFGGGVAAVPNYIEECFSTWLYTGNGSTQTITNGIDLAGKGGLVWTGIRTGGSESFVDTVRGTSSTLYSDRTSAAYTGASDITGFNSNGYSLGYNAGDQNGTSSQTFAGWTFREQPKFFDIQTFTTASNRSAFFNHSLGSVPGCVIIKSITSVTAWYVYHRSLGGNSFRLELNSANGRADSGTPWIYLTDTSIEITSTAGLLPQNQTYVAYLFAHNAGGFGLTGTDNVISCGSFTADGSGNATVNLGYEPQFWLYKPVGTGGWVIYDTMRGWSQTSIFNLNPNTSGAEGGGAATAFYPTATGFDCVGSNLNPSATYIYIAIRRGPMKVPTTGTSVYNAVVRNGTRAVAEVTGAGFPVDLIYTSLRPSGTHNPVLSNRLVGAQRTLGSRGSQAEQTENGAVTSFASMDGVTLGANNTDFWNGFNSQSGSSYVNWFFRRAPSVFDVVCYTGNSTARALTHNLTVSPGIVIIKKRNAVMDWSGGYNINSDGSSYARLALNTNSPDGGYNDAIISAVSATTFSVGTSTQVNASGDTYVAYLFATCPGVSKVGSYTGTGTAQTINCGFTAGARFVMIKRTDASDNWYVWDTARGITSGNDPYLFLNTTDAEVTNTDFIDPASTGFELSTTALATVNVNGGTYIFLAFA
jgi:hypothetical protein